MGGDRGVFVDRAEIGVQGNSGKGIMLDRLKKGEASAVTFDLKVDQDVFRTAMSKQVAEGLGVDLKVDVFGATSIDDRGNPAFAAQLLKASGSAACARGCLECGFLGHNEVGVGNLMPPGVTEPSAGAECLAGHSPLVKKLFNNPDSPTPRRYDESPVHGLDRKE